MKRLRVDEAAVKDISGHPQQTLAGNASFANRGLSAGTVHRQILKTTQHNTGSTIPFVSGGLKVVEPPGGMQSGLYSSTPVSYSAGATMPSATTPHSGGKPQAMQPLPISSSGQHGPGGGQMRNKTHGGGGSQSPPAAPASSAPQGPQQQSPSSCQRLKVEDALSYLDQVKFKFGNQPQVYNDFLDIMKEFKSQSIDTPGVIGRVSSLFKGHPELIVGFNTFLPSGYKIEVQANDQGYAFQVSVSLPSPTATTMQSGSVSHSGGVGQTQKPAVLQILQGSGTILSSNMTSQSAQSMAGVGQLNSNTQSLSLSNTPAVTSLPPSVSPATVATSTPSHHTPFQANNLVSHNNQHHHTMSQAQAAHQAVSQALSHVESGGGSSSSLPHHAPQNQPVEFNHAINYVNKIKNRFQGQPEKYKRFLEILHTYQKEQKLLKEGHHISGPAVLAQSISSGGATGPGGKHLTEAEVYSQVAELFENQEDLLAEFGQFLPDATNHQSALGGKSLTNDHSSIVKKPQLKPYNNPNAIREREHREREHREVLNMEREREIRERERDRHNFSGQKPGHTSGQIKRSPTYPINQGLSSLHRNEAPPAKKHKIASYRDVTLAEAGKYGTLNDYAFFDKVRKALRSQEVYENFLRCLILFNQEVISKSELVQLATPFLGKFPELFKWFKEFMGHCDQSIEAIPNNVARQERPQGDNAMEIDLTTCKRLGASYCALPKNQEGRKCSGRTQLCKEVLNDQWVSFPTWSEDSTFVTSRKTQYEEYIYRCEDERFELDVVIETNASTIRVLEGVQKKLNRMSPEEVSRFRLDDTLGGQSPVIHQRALKRIYGDKAQDIIEGLKRNPAVGVQVVLRRLKAKEEEWREAQKGFNKIWREQNEKYYLKSLDHQGINFKQNDVKALRSKSLFNEIETLYDERHEQNEEGTAEPVTGPHLVLPYRDKSTLDDAANLLIHHVKRQTGIQKNEKQRIKHILRQFVPDLFFHPRQQLSDDEREEEDEKDDADTESTNCASSPSEVKSKSAGSSPSAAGKSPSRAPERTMPTDSGMKSPIGAIDSDEKSVNLDIVKDEDVKVPQHALSSDPEEAYSLFMVNSNWYVFLRLHTILCERLTKMYERAVTLAEEESRQRTGRKESTAVALRLKPKSEIEIEDYYPAFLDMVKNVLDGNMDSNTYEDTLREMFGIHAYIAFTLDKVVSYAVRQLQHCVTERGATSCMELFQREQRKGAAGGLCSQAHKRLHAELAYQRKAEASLRDENCFKIYIYKKDCRMTIELLDTESDDAENVAEAEKWSTYVERYADSSVTASMPERKSRDSAADHSDGEHDGDGRSLTGDKAIFLQRNLRMFTDHVTSDKGNAAAVPELRDEPSEPNQFAEPKKASPTDQEEAIAAVAAAPAVPIDPLDGLERKLAEKGLPQRVNNTMAQGGPAGGLLVVDGTQCKLNSTTSKMLFVINKDNHLYKHSALTRAKQTHPVVTKRLNGKFRVWHKQWQSTHISDSQHKACTDWLMGRIEGVVPNRTRVLTNNDVKRTPYAPYNRYKVERLSDPAS